MCVLITAWTCSPYPSTLACWVGFFLLLNTLKWHSPAPPVHPGALYFGLEDEARHLNDVEEAIPNQISDGIVHTNQALSEPLVTLAVGQSVQVMVEEPVFYFEY